MSLSGPVQSDPPLMGGGLEQDLVLSLVPDSQVAEHSPTAQLAQEPSILSVQKTMFGVCRKFIESVRLLERDVQSIHQ